MCQRALADMRWSKGKGRGRTLAEPREPGTRTAGLDQEASVETRREWLERLPAKWKPVRVKKTRQNKNLESRSDSIGTEKALVAVGVVNTQA